MEYNIRLPRQHHLAEQSSSVRVETSALEVGRDRLLEHYLCQELFFSPPDTLGQCYEDIQFSCCFNSKQHYEYRLQCFRAPAS